MNSSSPKILGDDAAYGVMYSVGREAGAAVQSVFAEIAADLGVSIHRASYMLSQQIAVLGRAPLFWRPLSQRFGRRPVFLLSLACSLVGNVGCAASPSYATMGLCRAITAFFVSPALAVGSAVVAETFFKKERARYMGVWTVMVTLGTNAVQLVLYFFLGHETLYLRGSAPSSSLSSSSSGPKRSWLGGLLSFSRIDRTPLRPWDFVQPLTLATRRCIVIPAAAYAMVFLWGNVTMSVETGALFPEQFGFDPQQVGLQNISLIVGSLVGEQIGGSLSDWWMWRRRGKASSSSSSSSAEEAGDIAAAAAAAAASQPEFRLWFSYPGYLLTICGVRAGRAWNVTPLLGAGIAAAGNQVATTVATTYAVDCYRAVGVFVNLVRQTWGFVGPFWVPPLIGRLGLRAAAAVASAMLVAVSVVPTALVQWKGSTWR
ncbi:hypothetical protein VTG60DRAFT_4467 [Thermothelomyces hinnuleus]